jgi:SAM-dependent methyltransferase
MSTPAARPPNYGQWWNTNTKDVEWYQEIHDAREPIHAAFAEWLNDLDRSGDPIRSVLEIGCGRGVRYPTLFADRRYVGYDISQKEIEWCRENRHNPRHDYIVGDFITEGIAERFDLVFAHAVIDHVYDIDAFLRAAVEASGRWVYLTAYRGWFPDLREHRYSWSEQETCFYNDLSPARVHMVLTAAGCRPVRVSPSGAAIEPIGHETVVIAERLTPSGGHKVDPAWLRRHVVCPACLEGGLLETCDSENGEARHRCGRCQREYPVSPSGVIDLRVLDRLATLPDGALEMWELARIHSRESARSGAPEAVSGGAAEASLQSMAGARVLDVSNLSDVAQRAATAARQFVAVGDRPEWGRFTSLRAWPELLPFADESFDVVIAGRVLEQVLCLDSALRELRRVLRAGGLVYMWVELAGRLALPLYPPMFGRSDAALRGPGTGGRARALEVMTRRLSDADRLERVSGHLLADRTHLRFIPLRFLRNVPAFGFQPALLEVDDRSVTASGPWVALVQLRRTEVGAGIDRALSHQIDLLAETAAVGHQVTLALKALEEHADRIETLRRAVSEIRGEVARDLRVEVEDLRRAIDTPRTPFERVLRRVSRWWRQGARPG